MISAVFEFILRVLYFLVPVAIANMMPVFVRRRFKILMYPMDFHAKLFGRRILGDNKTIRGFLFAIIGGILASYLQVFLYHFFFFRTISIISYDTINPFLYGFLIAIGVIIGDAFGSFVKRMRGIPPGASFMPLDQIVAPTGAMLAIRIIYVVNFTTFMGAILISFFAHLIIKYIGYLLRLERRML